MNAWYMHPYTHVLLLASALPNGIGRLPAMSEMPSRAGAPSSAAIPYANVRAWERRGWCYFEGCASALVKHPYCLWDDRFYDASHAGDHALVPTVRRGRSGVAMVPESLDGLRQALRAGRGAPLSPSAFAEVMAARVAEGSLAFTSSTADMEMVIGLYASGFVTAFDTFPSMSHSHNIISFDGLSFGSDDEKVARLAAALAYVVAHCTFPHGPVRISLEGNHFSPADQAVLREAVKGCDGIAELYVGYESNHERVRQRI